VKKKILYSLLLLLVFTLNILLVHRAYQFSSHYPLRSLPLGTVLHFPVVYDSLMIDKKILTLNGKPVISGRELVESVCRNGETIEVQQNNGIMTATLEGSLNADVFFFLLFILFCANLHCIWGLIVNKLFSSQTSARLFGNYSFAVGIILFGFVHFLLYQMTAMIAAAGAVILSGLMIRAACYLLSFVKAMPRITVATLIMGCGLILLEYYRGPVPVLFLSFALPVISLLALIASIQIRLISNKLISRPTIFLFIVGTIISAVIPFWMMASSIVTAQPMPIILYITMSLLFLFIMANNVLSENFFMYFSVRKRYFMWLLADLVFAIIASYIIYRSVDVCEGITVCMILYCLGIFSMLFVMLTARRAIFRYIQTGKPVYREVFSEAIRRTSEISASPDDFRIKMEKIYRIVADITGAGYFHIELFELSIINKISGLEGMLSYSRGSRLEKYILKNPSLIFRHSILTGWLFDVLAIDRPMIELIVPVKAQGFSIGVMFTGSKERGAPFADDEIRFFNSLSAVIYQMIENEILFGEYIIKREYDREIDIASYIQMRLIPKYHPFGKGISAFMYSRPYLKVTGDYYDFIDIDDNRTLIAIGDVAGHGLSAATILATAGNMIHALIKENSDISDIINELNHFFSVRYRGTELMTLILMLFDRSDRSITYINAGHCMPVMCRNGGISHDFFSFRNPILGADRDIRYTAAKTIMQENDEILLYTDGVIEIQNDRLGNNVGEEMLISLLNETRLDEIEEKIEAFEKRIGTFNTVSIHDDITLIGIKVH
jgi:phosphoserine phosphatase RsbU/P